MNETITAPQIAPVSINTNAIQNTTNQITDIANVFGSLAVKIILALFIIYFFYIIIKRFSK